MRKSIKNKLAIAALIIGAGSAQVAAMPMFETPTASATSNLPIIGVHSLHNDCQYNSVTPSGTGTPKAWHRTAEAGVHTNCTPTRAPGTGKLKIKPSGGNSQSLQLRQ